MSQLASRPSLAVAISVWKALFLRESVRRLFAQPFAWGWVLLQPMLQIILLVFMFSAIRMREIGGIDTPQWVMVGFLAFMMFRFTAVRSISAIKDNNSLMLYRQVRGVDAVFVRIALEGFLHIVVSILLFVGAIIFDIDMTPDDPLTLMLAAFGMWLIGAGIGLIGSIVWVLVPALGRGIRLSMFPLFLASGVIFPIGSIPVQYREWVILNPLTHGPEAARHAFSTQYQAIPELNLGYLLGAGLCLVFLGLALHVRYAKRLMQE